MGCRLVRTAEESPVNSRAIRPAVRELWTRSAWFARSEAPRLSSDTLGKQRPIKARRESVWWWTALRCMGIRAHLFS